MQVGLAPRTRIACVPDILEVQTSTVKLPRLCNVRVGDDWLARVLGPTRFEAVGCWLGHGEEPDRSGLCWWFLD
jgi:hypothetical protein